MAELTSALDKYGNDNATTPTHSQTPASVTGSAGDGATADAYKKSSSVQDRTAGKLTDIDSSLDTYLRSLGRKHTNDKKQIQDDIDALNSKLARLPDDNWGKQQAATDIHQTLEKVEAIVHGSNTISQAVAEHVNTLTYKYYGLAAVVSPSDMPTAGVDPTTGTTVGEPAGGYNNPGYYTGTPSPSGGSSGFVTMASPQAVGGNEKTLTNLAKSKFGWGSTSELKALKSLETREAGFNNKATNPSSGAFGLGQALGHGTSADAANNGTGVDEYGGFGLTTAQAQEANDGNAADQSLWMLNYIKATYGSPEAAWAHEESYGWY